MTAPEVVLKPIPGLLVAERTRNVVDLLPRYVAPVVGPMFGELVAALDTAEIPVGEPAIAYYTVDHDDEQRPRVHVAFPVPPGTPGSNGFDVVELPAADLAACLVHHGSMETIGGSWMRLLDCIDAEPGIRAIGASREVYLEAEPRPMSDWVTDLQIPVARTA